MITKQKSSLSIPFIVTGIILVLIATGVTIPVKAEGATPPPESGCISCHENLYYLHDTGKWFCLCAEQMTCTCCHGGDPQSLNEDTAHTGMVLYPTRNEAGTCQQCHPQDYDARVEHFSKIAGVSSFHPPVPTSSPPAGISAGIQSATPVPARS